MAASLLFLIRCVKQPCDESGVIWGSQSLPTVEGGLPPPAMDQDGFWRSSQVSLTTGKVDFLREEATHQGNGGAWQREGLPETPLCPAMLWGTSGP